MKWAPAAGAGSLFVVGAIGALPGNATICLAVIGAVVYIWRLMVIWDLGCQAIEKTTGKHVPEVMRTITGDHGAPRPRGPQGDSESQD